MDLTQPRDLGDGSLQSQDPVVAASQTSDCRRDSEGLDALPTQALSRSVSTISAKPSLTAAKSDSNLESGSLGRSKSLKDGRRSFQHRSDSRLSAIRPDSYIHRHPNTGHSLESSTELASILHPKFAAHSATAGSMTHQTGHPDSLVHLESRDHAETDARMASATSSPGVFTPVVSPQRADFVRSDTPEPFSSPFLNYTRRQAPKETHLAEVEVDPISGRKLINHYEIWSELGRGVHGKVKLGRDLDTDESVAIKIVERVSKVRRLGRTGDQEAKIKREIAILKKARHPNIVGLLEVIDDPAKKKVYIVLELVELGEVEWRTRGEEEITLIEFRRHRREEEGIFENDAANQEDQHILETAHRHLEREEQRAFQDYQRTKSLKSTSFGRWTLEHGEDSDQDDTDGEKPSNPKPQDIGRDEHDEDTILFSGEPRRRESLDHTDATHHDTVSASRISRDLAVHDQYGTILDGTMYGAYDTSPPGHGNLLDSFQSEDDLQGEWIPEHYRYVPTMTLSEARQTIRDTVLGLEYLHYQGVVHRDIKPANLLQTRDRRVKISDFGVSYLGKAVTEDGSDGASGNDGHAFDEALELAKTVGTPAFYAPELCQTDISGDPPPVTNQIDVWALGVTLYCLVYGRIPFHDSNTFVLMRLIAEKEAYLPRRRLKAVEVSRELSHLSSTSMEQQKTVLNCNKRLPHELDYEDVDDDLHDLLKRLLTKDPRKRIKLVEVKHHPWVIAGMEDPSRWLDESAPSRITHGKRIEVSKDDLDVAVIPFNIGDQIKSIASRAAKKIGGALGIGRSHSRRRARSSATDTVVSSNASSSSTISQDAKRQEQRRPSLKPDADALFVALKQSREGEHPLAQSVTASPEMKNMPQLLTPSSLSGSPELPLETHPFGFQERPGGLERGMSATGSIRTIRQSDIVALKGTGAIAMPAFPSTLQPQDTAATSLGGIFGGAIGGAGKKFMKKIRTSSREFQKLQTRNSSSEISSLNSEMAYGEPSVALSNMVAAGEVDAPSALLEGHITSSSGAPSPVSSATGESRYDHVAPLGKIESLSRGSSLSSIASRGQRSAVDLHGHSKGPFLPLLGDDERPVVHHNSPFEKGDAITRAKDEQYRRLIQEQNRRTQSTVVSRRAPSPTASQLVCPPSPDDILDTQNSALPAPSLSSLGSPTLEYLPPTAKIVTSASEDHFMSGMSQSTSNPSLPSAYSADSSVVAEEPSHQPIPSCKALSTDLVQVYENAHFNESLGFGDDEGGLGPDDEEFEDDSDDGVLQMRSTKKPSVTGPIASTNG